MDKKPYVIHYDDSTYFVLDFTEEDYKKIQDHIRGGYSHVSISVGILKLTNVKAILEWIPPETTEDDPKEGDPGNLTPEAKNWLRLQRELDKDEGSDDD